MPTNFTVVPVKYNTRKAKEGDEEDDVDENNVLKEEEEDAAGERFFSSFMRYAMQIKNFQHFMLYKFLDFHFRETLLQS